MPSSLRSRPGRCSRRCTAFAELLDLGLVEGTQPRLVGGQAEGCQPVARAFADDAKLKPVRPNTIARSLAIGSPADGELAVSTARASGGAVYAVAEDEIADNVAFLAETTGIFGETAPGVTLGALREAVRRGELGENDRVVLLVTGDGLKTPSLVADRLAPTFVEPDADLILDSLSTAGGVAMRTGPRSGFRWNDDTIVYAITLWYRKQAARRSRASGTRRVRTIRRARPSRACSAAGTPRSRPPASPRAPRPSTAVVRGGSVCRRLAANGAGGD